jgi:hypothetical protein
MEGRFADYASTRMACGTKGATVRRDLATGLITLTMPAVMVARVVPTTRIATT